MHTAFASTKLKTLDLTQVAHMCITGVCLQVPVLLSAASRAAVQMLAQQAAAAAAVLSQLPMLAHLVQLYHDTWPQFSRLLCGELTAEEQAVMRQKCAVWKQHQQHQQQLQQLQGSARKSAAAVSAAARLVSVGSSSILLRQLLGMAAAAAATEDQHHSQQQQQHVTTCVLHWATVLGGEVGLLVADLLAALPSMCILEVFGKKSTSIMTGAVQLFEAALRHLLAAGCRHLPNSTSDRSSSGSSSPVVPPSTVCIEMAVASIYPVLIHHGYNSTAGGSSSSSSSWGLSNSQQQLLQALLSMLLTSSKLWNAGLQPPLGAERLWNLALAAQACMLRVAAQWRACHPTGTPAAAAAVLGAAGGVQVCHLVSQYLNCFAQQLRQWVATEDAVGAAKWLSTVVESRVVPLPGESNSMAAAAAARADSRFDVLCYLIEEGYAIVVQGLGGKQEVGLHAKRSGLLTKTSSAGTLLQLVLAGLQTKSKSVAGSLQRQQQLALLGELGGLADALQGYGSALTAALPSRFGCNWPGCVRLSGVSEGYGLVRGQACVCGGCRQAR
jgi:hypothetical protein